MKTGDWRTEVEAIDGQLRALLERRSQLLRRATPRDAAARPPLASDTRGLAYAVARAAAPHHAHLPHPEAHLALGDLP